MKIFIGSPLKTERGGKVMNLDDDNRSRGDGYQSFIVFADCSKWLRLLQFMDFILFVMS